jgi:hypothetical protein
VRGPLLAAALMAAAAPLPAQVDMATRILPRPAEPGGAVLPFLRVHAPVPILRHVRLIDGTGAPPVDDRSIVVRGGVIDAIGGPELARPEGAAEFDLTGRSVMPGIVGMHEHLFYIAAGPISAPTEACFSPDPTRRPPASRCPGAATTGRSSFSSGQASLRSSEGRPCRPRSPTACV